MWSNPRLLCADHVIYYHTTKSSLLHRKCVNKIPEIILLKQLIPHKTFSTSQYLSSVYSFIVWNYKIVYRVLNQLKAFPNPPPYKYHTSVLIWSSSSETKASSMTESQTLVFCILFEHIEWTATRVAYFAYILCCPFPFYLRSSCKFV